MRRRRRASRDLIHLPLALDATPPDPAALFAIDGFDALPRALRDVMNYSRDNIVLGSSHTTAPPCREVSRLVTQHGLHKVLTVLQEIMNSDAGSADRRAQNTHRAVSPKTESVKLT